MPSRFWRNRPCLPLSMSEIDFSGRLPGPVTGRPRRPLSNSESTASWSIRFSLFTMISGAPRSSSRLRRLLRLITRRYRSLRSEVANRPPSSCTMGRRSGGMTGTASSTMPSGLLVVLRNAETTLSRFRARVFRCPLPVWMMVRSDSGLGLEVEVVQALLDRLGTHVAREVLAEAVLHLAVEDLVALEVLHLERLEAVPDRVEPVELTLGAVAQQLDLALAALADLLLDVGLGALGLELRQILLELLEPVLDIGVTTLPASACAPPRPWPRARAGPDDGPPRRRR